MTGRLQVFWGEVFKNHYHLGALITAVVGLDYLQAIMLYDSRMPYLSSLISCRYFAVALMVSGFLRYGLRHCWFLGFALLLADGVFFVSQSEWILSSPEWWYVRLPFFANVSFSCLSWLFACVWMHFSLWGIALESLVLLCGFGVWLFHFVYQDVVDVWFVLLQGWLKVWQLSSAQTDSLAANMAITMSSSIVSSYVLVPAVFVCVWALSMQPKSGQQSRETLCQWYGYRISWVAFIISALFYGLSVVALWALPYCYSYETTWHDMGFLAYLFDIAHFAPCVAGLSLMHLYIDTSLATKKSFWRLAGVLLLFTVFYAFHQLFVWVGLADKLLDVRKRYNLVRI